MTRPSLRRPQSSALRLEHLEDRSVPAGNVTAAVSNFGGVTTLHLTGDLDANRVNVSGLSPGVVAVKGVSTTVNGGKGTLTFSKIDAVDASLLGGNDNIRATNLKMQTLSVPDGAGDDVLLIDQCELTTFNFQSTAGSDTVRIADSKIGSAGLFGELSTRLDIYIDQCQVDSVAIATGEGHDHVRILGTALSNEDQSSISTLGGNDEIVIRNSSASLLSIEGNGGDDAITISGCTFSRSTGFEMLLNVAGDDVSVLGSEIGNDVIRVTNCKMGGDGDVFALFQLAGDNLYDPFTSGTIVGGNDVIDVSDITYTGSAEFGASLTFTIIGDRVGSGGTLIGGNDDITVRNVHILNTPLSPYTSSDVSFAIIGGSSGAGTIIGDNDVIRIVNTSVVIDDPSGSAFFFATVVGDQAYTDFGSGERGTIVGGNDVIEITDSEFRYDSGFLYAQILGEEGSDTAITGGNDTISLTNVDFVGGSFASVSIIGESVFFFGGPPIAPMVGGNDTVTLTCVTVRTTTPSLPGEEPNTVLYVGTDGGISYGSGSGADMVAIRVSSIFRLELSTGNYDDTVDIRNSTFDSIFADLGTGDDTFTLRNSSVGQLDLSTGQGKDTVDIRNCAFDILAVDLGDGDDSATIKNNTATTSIAVEGGLGFDTLLAWHNTAPDLVFHGFEA